MTDEEPLTLMIRIPRDKILWEKEDCIMADLGDPEKILQLCLAAMSNPNKGVTLMERKE